METLLDRIEAANLPRLEAVIADVLSGAREIVTQRLATSSQGLTASARTPTSPWVIDDAQAGPQLPQPVEFGWTIDDAVEEMTALVAANPYHDERGRFAPKGVGRSAPPSAESSDAVFKAKYGNERLSGDGNCFSSAVDRMMGVSDADAERYRLVHGVVAGQAQLEGKRFDHAWVERRDDDDRAIGIEGLPPEMAENLRWTVLDNSNGNDIEMPRIVYYGIGNITEGDVVRYTRDEMMLQLAQTRNYGPWT